MSEPAAVQSIFHAALEKQSPEERDAYLAQACGDDAELRREVERLLAAYPQVGSFLEPPAREVGATIDDRHAQRPGMVIGPYKLLQEIGEGGMGTVWMAEQTQPVQRKVALKIIKAGMDSRHVLARFEAERQALALMDHPNIARVLDAGATSEGRPYFVMELVKGQPITQYCDEHRLTPKERLQLFVPVCQAIQHAHQKGIIHRDIKPSNVLVAPYDGKPVVKVIDFGVAKATGRRLTDKTLFTEFGAVVGTLEYMSPEQAELNNKDIDTRSDIYSLGVLLYELLTGTTPLDRKRLKEGAFVELLRLIREEEPPKPSTRLSESKDSLPSVSAQRQMEPAKLTRLVRGELDWIVMKCLEKERSRRYETANGLARDIERYLHDEAVDACPPSTRYRLHKFARKHKHAFVTAAVIVVILTLGAILSAWLAVRARQAEAAAMDALKAEAVQRGAAEQQRDRADRSAAEARAVIDFLSEDLLGQADPNRNTPDKRMTVEELLLKAEQAIAANPHFTQHPAAEATLRATIGNTYFKLGLLGEAERHLREAVRIRQKSLGADDLLTLAAQETLADFLIRGPDRPSEAEPLSRQTWEARRRVLGPEHRDTLNSMDTYAQALQGLGRPEDAKKLYEQCLEARQRLFGPHDEDALVSMNNLAVLLLEMGNPQAAIPILSEVVKVRQMGSPMLLESAMTVANLASAHYQAGNLTEANRLITDELASGKLAPEIAETDRLAGLALRIWVDQGRLDEAIQRGREVVIRRRMLYSEVHHMTGAALLDLGRALALKGEYKEAEPILKEASEILRRITKHFGHFPAWSDCWRGVCLAGLKRYKEAEDLLLLAEGGLRMHPSTPPRHYRQAVEQLVLLYESSGRPAEAGKWRKELELQKPLASRTSK
jgi:serine/threonine protein kinase/tetratricopeptide (TPR) repeat protein